MDRNTRTAVHEVGLRDGLQMEAKTVPTAVKLDWIRRLAGAGLDAIQVGSFVHPEKVPQMADTDRLFAEIRASGDFPPGLVFSALVLNEKGLERGFASGVSMFCMGVSASETHSRKNTGMGTAEATERIMAMARQAREAGCRVQVSVQSAFGCGYEGAVPGDRVLGIARRFVEAGLPMVSLADTAGHATPDQVEAMVGSVAELDPGVEIACHFHNTYGMAMANAYAALRAGATNIESSIAGLGGCPFTQIAGGNLCTEDFVHMLHRMNCRADIRLEPLLALSADVTAALGREPGGVLARTGPIPDRPHQPA